jgi:hypothetical protein
MNDFMTDIRLGGQPIERDDDNLEGINENYLDNDYSSYSLSHLQVVFYMLLFGYGFSILAFLGELLYHRKWVIKITATERHGPRSKTLESPTDGFLRQRNFYLTTVHSRRRESHRKQMHVISPSLLE